LAELLDILYQDEHLVAINKPSGLLTHRSMIDRHETRFALQMVRDQTGRRVWAPHRLDKGTSGVLLFAFSQEWAAALGRQFEAGSVGKRYLAVVRGHPEPEGVIDHPLSRQRDDYEWQGEAMSEAAQPAVTRYTRLAITELPIAVERYPTSRYALVDLAPLTGRKHQLRRHLKHIAHPIIGDSTYGKGRHNRMFAEHLGCQRLLLACTELTVAHPVSGATLKLKAPVTDDFAGLLARLNWADPSRDQ